MQRIIDSNAQQARAAARLRRARASACYALMFCQPRKHARDEKDTALRNMRVRQDYSAGACAQLSQAEEEAEDAAAQARARVRCGRRRQYDDTRRALRAERALSKSGCRYTLQPLLRAVDGYYVTIVFA